MAASLKSLNYVRGSLEVLDQLQLPHTVHYIQLLNIQDSWRVIREMNVRGAPLIALTAVLSLAVEVDKKRQKEEFKDVAAAVLFLQESMAYLRTSRPTAVNLFVATDELSSLITRVCTDQPFVSVDQLVDQYIAACEAMLHFDYTTNLAIGHHGAKRILELVPHKKVRVLTICNTGSLATSGHGTALGVVRSLHAMQRLEQVYACETRPYNQGARLTAFEIVQDNLPGTLITDSMAAALMAQGKVDCVIVGADRVAANGDVANKIGTYQLAISAKYHDIPFFAAVPTTTLDLTIACGSAIQIEERPGHELTSIGTHKIAPDGIAVWNPAFDVTPCALITGIITELGMIEADANSVGEEGMLHIADYILRAAAGGSTASQLCVNENINGDLLARCRAAAAPVVAPTAYRKLDELSVAAYIRANAELCALLEIDYSASSCSAVAVSSALSVKEVGDGNLNFVYLVEGSTGKTVVVKQALPYVRCVGESWPLSLTRAHFECKALREERQLTGGKYVPEVFHFDEAKALIVMQYIEPPHAILRKLLIARNRIGTFAVDLGKFCACTLFSSSALNMDGSNFRSRVAEWSGNKAMCALSEKVIFTDPYMNSCSNNRWTSPQLDDAVRRIQSDAVLQLAAAYHKSLFLGSTQALLHGDLHTGSVMAKEGSTFVIDPEFGFYGPIGFDTGALLANLFLSYFAHCTDDCIDDGYADWLLTQVDSFYSTFSTKFVELWTKSCSSPSFQGELFPHAIYVNTAAQSAGGINACTTAAAAEQLGGAVASPLLALGQQDFMCRIWRDCVGFAGTKMIRRVIGIAHVEDMESIADPNKRAKSELKALRFAVTLVQRSYLNDLERRTVKNLPVDTGSTIDICNDLSNIAELVSYAKIVAHGDTS